MDYIMNFAKSLDKVMKKNKLTNDKLSKMSGVAEKTVSRLRAGTLKDPKIKTMIAICDVINVSIDEMLDRDCCGIDETLMMNYHLLSDRDKKIAELILSDDDKEDD